MNQVNLQETARMLVAPGKGLLAADESTGTIERRLKSIEVPCTEETRRRYRELLFTTPGVGEFLSGVILFDETMRQKSEDGVPFPEVLARQGIIPGIKVDEGKEALANFRGDKVTRGLDHLRERLPAYREQGARFTKWRAVFAIGPDNPSETCYHANAQALAQFAALSQEAGLVPIVEPEVLRDGHHTIDQCLEVTERALRALFQALPMHRVVLEHLLLKPNMVLSGAECSKKAGVAEVAEATVRCLRSVVPPAVPGVVFLSGGQDEIAATQHLNAMNQIDHVPWELSFSFARALQWPAMRAWGGKDENRTEAQKALYHRAHCNSAARFGKYTEQIEQEAAAPQS